MMTVGLAATTTTVTANLVCHYYILRLYVLLLYVL